MLDQSGFRAVAPHDQPAAPSQQPAANLPSLNGDAAAQHAQHESGSGHGQQAASFGMELSNIACVKPCSLPPGFAFWVSLHSQTQGLYFVAEVSEDAEGWVDALHMAYAVKQGRMQMLGKALAVANGEQQYHSALTQLVCHHGYVMATTIQVLCCAVKVTAVCATGSLWYNLKRHMSLHCTAGAP